MSQSLHQLERRVEHGMVLLAGESPSPRPGALQRVRRVMLAEAERLGAPGMDLLGRRARVWLTAAAVLLAVGLSRQLGPLRPIQSAVDPAQALSEWAAAMDHATNMVVSLHEDPWLPEEPRDPREEPSQLDDDWESFDRAFDLGA